MTDGLPERAAPADAVSDAAPDAARTAGPSAPPGRAMANAVGVQLGGRMLGMIASVLTVVLTTRHLGVERYGLLTIAVVFTGLWTSLTELGVGAVIVRRVASGTGSLERLVGVNLGLSLVYCVPLGALAAVSGLVVYQNRPEVRGVLVAVSVGLVLTSVSSSFGPVFAATVRFAPVALADALSRIAALAATGLAVRLDGGLVWFGVVQLAAPLVVLVVHGVAARRIVRVRPHLDLTLGLRLLRESLPQTAVLIVGVLYWRADAVILSLVGGVPDVGAYGIAYTAAFTLSVLSSFYLASSLAEMSARFARDVRSFAGFVAAGMQAMIFLGLPIAVVGGVLARPLIELLSTARFADAAAVPFTLLLVCVGLTFVTGVLSQALFAAHEQAFLLRLNLVNLAANIALNLAFAPVWGAVGAAVALLVSEVSGVLGVTWRLHRHGYRTPVAFALRVLVPLAPATVIALVLRDGPVLVAGAAAVAVYLGGNLALGPVRARTVRALVGAGAAP